MSDDAFDSDHEQCSYCGKWIYADSPRCPSCGNYTDGLGDFNKPARSGQRLPRIWVIANFKETQIRNMRAGQSATITVDAFPGRELHGHVLGFAPGTGSQFALLPPDNATGNFTKVVQRVAVKISVDDDPALRALLRPGLSVIASVRTGS